MSRTDIKLVTGSMDKVGDHKKVMVLGGRLHGLSSLLSDASIAESLSQELRFDPVHDVRIFLNGQHMAHFNTTYYEDYTKIFNLCRDVFKSLDNVSVYITEHKSTTKDKSLIFKIKRKGKSVKIGNVVNALEDTEASSLRQLLESCISTIK